MSDLQTTVSGPGPFRGLYGGRIIQAIVQALDLGEGVLADRTARRFYGGEFVDQYNLDRIYEALGQALIDLGIVPETVDALPEGASMASAVGLAIGLACEHWDHLMADIQSNTGPINDLGAAGERLLRLVVVDLALRVFALVRVDGDMEPPKQEMPQWVQENGGGMILRDLASLAGLTRNQLALRVGVSYTSVDNWLDGNNWPRRANVAELATALGPAIGRDVRQLERELQREFTLARLADRLAAWVGREAVIEMVSGIGHLARLLLDSIGFPLSREEHPNHVELRLFLYGCLEEAAPSLLWHLSQLEDDPGWKSDILAAASPWEIHFEAVSTLSGGPESAAGLAQDLSDAVGCGTGLSADPADEVIWQELSKEAEAILASPTAVPNLGDILGAFQEGIERRRGLVRRFPESPQAHYQLGSFLGMAGKNSRALKFVDEGIVECWIAAGLAPGWDAPAVEPGIILANIGEYEASLRELKRAEEFLSEATPHLRFAMGYTLTMLERFVEALEHLEAVIESRPDYALAYRYAARCAFLSGDKGKGLRYAKAARRLGDFHEYTAWLDGAYSSRR